MASFKTRMNSNQRQRLMAAGAIRPAHIPMEEVAERSEVRKIGNRAASRINAVLARRAEFKGH